MKQLMVVLVAVLALGLGACSKDGPAVKEAKKLVAQASDERKANDLRQAAWPQPVRCDAGTPDLNFIDGATDEPLVFYVKNDDGRVLCFDRAGFVTNGTKMGAVLMPVTRPIVAEILSQPRPPQRRPAPMVTQLPDISDPEPCTERCR